MNTLKKILILEDNLLAVSHLCSAFHELEYSDNEYKFAVTVLATYTDVEELVNNKGAEYYDVILLDRDCKAGGSFHILDIEKFNPERIVAISSVPEWNEEAKKRGVNRIVDKNFAELEMFTMIIIREVVNILKKIIYVEK